MSSGGGCCAVCKVVALVAAIGAINWGLYGVANVDLVARLAGSMTTAARVIYGLIGLSGLLAIGGVLKLCPCSKGACTTK